LDDLFLGRIILSIEQDKKLVLDDHGTLYKHEKLLLATGGTLRRLSFGPQDIITARSMIIVVYVT
jgi:3-phenylpropionate/trans-cinnamate dioxygenase ferredoxin reductase subunit